MAKKEDKKRKNRDLKGLVENPPEGVIIEHRPPNIVDLAKNKEVCEQITQSSCWRPDIYLDLGCLECSINEYCACPIKKLIKRDEPLRGRKRKK